MAVDGSLAPSWHSLQVQESDPPVTFNTCGW
jgi:hypothetical protein